MSEWQLGGPTGIVRHGKKLAYGVRHGALLWLPYPLKKLIVHWWNWTACRIFGHDRLTIPAEDGWEAVDSCVNCCKKFEGEKP